MRAHSSEEIHQHALMKIPKKAFFMYVLEL